MPGDADANPPLTTAPNTATMFHFMPQSRRSILPTLASAPNVLPERAPQPGELVQVRSRRWLVEETIESAPGESARVALACADDDNQGQTLTVFWDYEPDRRILQDEGWDRIAAKGFDATRQFAAFYNTLRWHCTTATDPNLFQAPFRAGIKIDAYQMEPLRKALRLPRVNLFIADDTGLGKTIEAGLIARELIQRRKAKTIVVAAPPSVLEQWKTELEDRFGLIFEILDRAYVSRMRRERGFGVNPWRTHSRFLISHNLLIDAGYTDPMREWLGDLQPASLLILDEAHHAAPSSGGRYGIETKFTKAVRELSHRFEHRLFLSATPHNGHSNSFSTLLELLDPYRFTRGVKVRKAALDQVMVRRLKEDIRETRGGFPMRHVDAVVIDNLPDDAPELVLSQLLDEYRTEREKRHSTASNRARAAAGLLVVGLQQRLLSSIEAFARSLRVHRETVARHRQKELEAAFRQPFAKTFTQPADADDERASLTDDELDEEDQAEVKALTSAAEAQAQANAAHWQHEQELLDQMQEVAEETRHLPDAKTRHLIDWIRDNLCPDLPPFGQPPTVPSAQWTDRRVLIFTENRQGTKRYLRSILEQAIEGTDRADERIAVIDGNTTGPRRKDIQRRFNRRPAEDPLRILLATDAAREGLNFQAHCTDLFHFDLPWNPGRIEQRNGRIDRKLQPAPEVHCRYFILPQRAEDRVLEVLVKKTDTIKRELGSLAKVIEGDIEQQLRQGIRHSEVETLRGRIENLDLAADRKRAAEDELEAARDRQDALEEQIERCQSMLETSRRWSGFNTEPFRDALSCSLDLLGAPPLQEGKDDNGNEIWTLPPLEQRSTTDPSWTSTLDSLRAPAQDRPVRGRVAQRRTDSAGGVPRCWHCHRRHGASASRTTPCPTPAGPVPRPRLRPPRPFPGLPRPNPRLRAPRHPIGSPVALWPRRGTTSRGHRARGGKVERSRAPPRAVASLRPRRGRTHASPARTIPRQSHAGTQRGHSASLAQCRAPRCGRSAATVGGSRRRPCQGRAKAPCRTWRRGSRSPPDNAR